MYIQNKNEVLGTYFEKHPEKNVLDPNPTINSPINKNASNEINGDESETKKENDEKKKY